MLSDLEVFALRAERLPAALRALLYPELSEHDWKVEEIAETGSGK